MNAATKATLKSWAENLPLDTKIKRLIGQAKYCLYYGPDMEGEEDWPGWDEAITQIRQAMEEHIQDIWVDTNCGEVLTSEPQSFTDENPEYDPEDEDSEETITYEPCWEDYCLVEAREVKVILLGELASYI